MKVRAPATPRAWLIAAVAVGLIALVPTTMSAQTTGVEFEASLSGASEVPANESAATGTFTATLNTADELEWNLSVPEIEEATAAHLHLGAIGENGPVVVSLFTAPEGGPVDSIDASGITAADGIVGPIEGDFEAFVAALNAGEIYVNVHTSALPGGEIRGQVAQVTPETPTSLTAPTFGTGNVGAAVFAGGTIQQLATQATAFGGTAVWAQNPTSGAWVRYDTMATGATAFVNNAFEAAFSGGFSGSTAVFVVK